MNKRRFLLSPSPQPSPGESGGIRNRLHRKFLALACLIILFGIDPSFAAPPSFPQQRPSDVPLELPDFETEQKPPLQLPPVPAPPPGADLSRQARVFVREIQLDGNSVFSDEELGAVIAGYTNREITSGELQELRYRLTLYYVERGYINSGAIIPDQQVNDGIITLRIIEGKLSDIRVSGERRLRPAYIRERAALGGGPPLNIVTLGEQLQILQQNPRIERLNATLDPGAAPGESQLNVQIQEAQPYELWLDLDNAQSPSVGGESASLRALHRNLTGRGDTLGLDLRGGEGLTEWNAAYTLPLTARDTRLRLSVHDIDSKVVEAPFDALDVKSEETTVSLGLVHPVHRTLNETFTLGLALDLRRSKSFLLGASFPFVPGTDNGESRLSVLRFSQEWLRRGREKVMAARSLFSGGIDAFDATVNGEPGDGEFFAWLGQFQWAHRLNTADMQLIFRADAQLANGVLPSMEQFTVGGINTVRGYRENRLIADTGFVASLEARIPVYDSESGDISLQVAPFIDYGHASNRSGIDPVRSNITSAGIGLLGNLLERIHFRIYYGHAFEEFDDEENNLQDKGFSFTLSARLM